MKKIILLLFAGILVSSLNCGGNTADVRISLTNPNNKTVPFSGYYIITATNDSVAMVGSTPREYTLTLSKGESTTGSIYKNTVDVVDTLHFQVFLNDEEKLSQKVTTLIEVIQFSIQAQ
ncbi:MAG: hypothetical protein WBB37_01805 [bacterium]